MAAAERPTSTRAEQAEEPGSKDDDPGSTEGPPGGEEGQPADDGDDPRRVAHELLGQAHAVLTIAVRDDVLQTWCPPELRPAIVDTAEKVAIAVGSGHVVIASGTHDAALNAAGIGGPLARPKRRGLRIALQRLTEVMGSTETGKVRSWMKASAGWAKLAVTSIGKSVPGVELIAEALDVVLSGIDTTEAIGTLHDDKGTTRASTRQR